VIHLQVRINLQLGIGLVRNGDKMATNKDACYHKVKKAYKVWPSAYASGALAKCRKVGAANWGNSKKKASKSGSKKK
jgi:hypothetical protein